MDSTTPRRLVLQSSKLYWTLLSEKSKGGEGVRALERVGVVPLRAPQQPGGGAGRGGAHGGLPSEVPEGQQGDEQGDLHRRAEQN